MDSTTNLSASATAATPALPDEESLYDVPTSVVILLSVFYGLISLTALVGNTLVIYVVAVSARMHTVTNYYIANLAFADVTIALFAIPFQFRAALLQRWDLPEFMCQFCPTVQILSVNVSIFTLVAISLDRYRAIMYPLRRKPGTVLSKLLIAAIWLLSLAFALPMGFFHTFGYVPDHTDANNNTVEKPFCYMDLGTNETNSTVEVFKYYSISLVTAEYFVPLSVISFAYLRIACRLWGSKTPGAAHDERDHAILVNKKKVIKMLVIVVLIFAFCWLPWQTYMTAVLVSPSVNDYRYINIIFFICHWLAMSNSCYNPFIYSIYSEKFRREFRARLPCLRPLLGSPDHGGNTNTEAKAHNALLATNASSNGMLIDDTNVGGNASSSAVYGTGMLRPPGRPHVRNGSGGTTTYTYVFSSSAGNSPRMEDKATSASGNRGGHKQAGADQRTSYC